MTKILSFVFLLLIVSCVSSFEDNIEWVNEAGGGGNGGNFDIGLGVTVDDMGNVYAVGSFEGNATFGDDIIIAPPGIDNGFVSKIMPNSTWIWTTDTQMLANTLFNDTVDVAIYNVVTDSNFNVYVVGDFRDETIFNRTIFVAKLDSAGIFQWVNWTDPQLCFSELPDLVLNNTVLYVTSNIRGNCTFGPDTIVSVTKTVMVATISIDGDWLGAVPVSTDGETTAPSISRHEDSFYIAGSFDGNITFGATTLEANANFCAFVAKLNINGTWLWARMASGVFDITNFDIVTDASGNIYVVGSFKNIIIFDNFNITTLINSGTDIYIARLNSFGSWIWGVSNLATSDVNNFALSIASNNDGLYISGRLKGTYFFGTGIFNSGLNNGFIASMDFNGVWTDVITIFSSGSAGSIGSSVGAGVAADSTHVYGTGFFTSFTTITNSTIISKNGTADIFILKMGLDVITTTPTTIAPTIQAPTNVPTITPTNVPTITPVIITPTDAPTIITPTTNVPTQPPTNATIPSQAPTKPVKNIGLIIALVAMLIVLIIIVIVFLVLSCCKHKCNGIYKKIIKCLCCTKCMCCSICNTGNGNHNKGSRRWEIELGND